MRKALIAAAVLVSALAPAPAFAWGFAAHQFIMRRAIDLLPPELKPFFERHRDEVVLRVTDPDLWRNIGWPDDPNHFMDFGVREYGPYPFTALPREYGAALEKFGAATLDRNGRLPWRLAEMFGKLRRGFEGFARDAPYAVSDVIVFSAVTSHYMQDALSAAARRRQLRRRPDRPARRACAVRARSVRALSVAIDLGAVAPETIKPVTNPRDAAFDVLLESYQLVDELLAADKKASEGRELYDDVYFDRFFESVGPMLERRLSGAIAATAGVISGAWMQAGRPAVRLDDVRPVQKVEREPLRPCAAATNAARSCVTVVPDGRVSGARCPQSSRAVLRSARRHRSVRAEPPEGFFRRWAFTATERWHALVETARDDAGSGRLARWRNAAICAVAESIAEQRTLWALKGQSDRMRPFSVIAQRRRGASRPSWRCSATPAVTISAG